MPVESDNTQSEHLTPASAESAAYIGRHDELLGLKATVDELRRGRGSVKLVVGAAGSGKSWLLQRLVSATESGEATVARAYLNPSSLVMPYEIWRQIVGSLHEKGGLADEGMLAVSRSVIERLRLSQQPTGDVEIDVPALPAEQSRYRMYDAVRQVLALATQKAPLVLLIDDLQYADEASIKLFRYFLPFMSSMPVAFIASVDEQHPTSTNLSALVGVKARAQIEYLRLEGLSQQEVGQLLSVSGTDWVPSGHVNVIYGLTRGVPLHVQLIAQLLKSRNANKTPAEGDVALEELIYVGSSVSRTVAELIASQLSSEELTIAEAASIYPNTFVGAELSELLNQRPSTIQHVMDKLVKLGFAQKLPDSSDVFSFRHAVFRRVLWSRLDYHDKLNLIKRALGLKTSRKDDPKEIWLRAEWHYTTRGTADPKAGVDECERAAYQAGCLSSPEFASKYLTQALVLMDLAGKPDRRLLVDHALSAADAGSLELASQSAWRAIETAYAETDDQLSELDLLVKMAVRLHDVGAGDELWTPFRDRALSQLEFKQDVRWARLQLLDGGQMQKISGPPLQVGRWLGLNQVALRIARADGDEDDYCRTLFVYEWHSAGDIDDLLRRVEKWRSPANIARALSVAAETLMYRHGEFDRACTLLERQRAMHEQSGSIVEQAKSLVRMTMALLAAGELDMAIATRHRAREMVDRLGPGYLIYEHAGTTRGGDLYPEISMESNFAWYIEGNWQAVANHWVYAIGLEEPGGSPVHIIEAAMAAQAFARLERFEDARVYLNELTPVLKHLQPRDWGFNGAVGRASHAIWDMAATEYAEDYRDFALRLLAAGVGDWTNTSLELTVARTAALLGRDVEARTYFEMARSKLSLKVDDPRLAIIDFDEAVSIRLMGTQKDGRRESLLVNSMSTFSRWRMEGWSRRVSQELQKNNEVVGG